MCTEVRKFVGVERPPRLTVPVLASPYASVTEDPILILQENLVHTLDRVSYMAPLLNFDVLDGALTKLGEAIPLAIGMAVVNRVGLGWNLCASSGWPARGKVRHWEWAF